MITTDNNGYVYIAGSTTSGNFPVTNALEPLPPQGAIEVSVNGGSFANSGLPATGASAVAASSDGHLVIASTTTGFYLSTNSGTTWVQSADVLPPAAALAVDPSNPSNAYAFLQNGSFYKSTNGGVNWQATGATLAPMLFTQLVVVPGSPATLYTLVYTGGSSVPQNVSGNLERSTNGGQSWQVVPVPNSTTPVLLSAFAVAPSQPNVIYASVGAFPGSVFVSNDGGNTWTQGAANTSAVSPAGLAVDPANASNVWLVEGDTSIRESTDGGASFQVVTTFPDTNEYAASGGFMFVAVDPANPQQVYASSTSAIVGSSDGGQTWSTLYGYSSAIYAAPSNLYALGATYQAVFLTKFDALLSQVIYSTYLWTGSVAGITSDAQGDVYLVGSGLYSGQANNGIVTKVAANGGASLYSTVLNNAYPNAIAVDSEGNAALAGTATSQPATSGAFQSTLPGPCPRPIIPWDAFLTQENTHAFVAKLNSSGSLTSATYLTGSCGDTAYAVALDSAGDVYVGGETYSPDFPVSGNAMTSQFPSTYSAGFISELSPALDQLLYSTFLGGGYFTAVHAMTFDSAGNAYLTGSTLASPTPGAASAITPASCPQVIGIGPSQTQPPPGENPFVMKMTLSGAPPAFLATVGGTCRGEADSLAMDAAGDIWIAGWNKSSNYPAVAPVSGLAQAPTQYLVTGFLTELNPSGTTVLSSTMTDSPGAVAEDSTAVYYTGGIGDLNASGVPTGNYAALVAEIAPAQTASIVIDKITQYSPLVPTGSLLPSAVAPGEIMRIFGRGIGPQNGVGAKLNSNGTLATTLGGVTVTFNGVIAPLLGAQATQVIAIVPFELTGLTSATLQVQYNGLTSNTYTVQVVPQNADILAVANSDWTLNSPSNPAKPGSAVAIFMTGLGQTNPPSTDGAINSLPLASLAITPAVTFSGNFSAAEAYLGAAAYEVAGVSQLNVVLLNPLTPAPGQVYVLGVGVNAASVDVYVQ